MNTEAVAQAFAEAFNAGDFDKVAEYLADDFQFSGPTPQPLGAGEWLGMSRALQAAFPDIQYNLRILNVEGHKVVTTTQLSGTHTGELDLTPMGLGVIPPTGKTFSNPEEGGEMVVEDSKVVSIRVEAAEGSGLEGILRQIGVQPPSG